MFPKVPDQHKVGRPLIPTGLGVFYVLTATVYLFVIYFSNRVFSSGLDTSFNGVSAALTLAVCILFGGFMGLLDDFMDLKWRYKAFMPLIAALPLMYFTLEKYSEAKSVFTILLNENPSYSKRDNIDKMLSAIKNL